MKHQKNKKGAMEMSMGTIVVLVLGVSMLILGMILIRNIMCSGLQITDDLGAGIKNEIKNLFGADKYGVKCVGTGGADIKLATGGRRSIVCIVKENAPATYDIAIAKTDVTSLDEKVLKSSTVQSWILGAPGASKISVKSGGDGQDVVVLHLNIPDDAPESTIQIKMTSTKEGSSPESIVSVIDISPTGLIKGAIC